MVLAIIENIINTNNILLLLIPFKITINRIFANNNQFINCPKRDKEGYAI